MPSAASATAACPALPGEPPPALLPKRYIKALPRPPSRARRCPASRHLLLLQKRCLPEAFATGPELPYKSLPAAATRVSGGSAWPHRCRQGPRQGPALPSTACYRCATWATLVAATSASRNLHLTIAMNYFTENAPVVALPGACPTPMLEKLWRDDRVVRE